MADIESFAEAVRALKGEIFRGISEAFTRAMRATHHVEQAALADIIAHRDDDTPRLIFADWLDDNDQPERAEFIRVQCAIERTELACSSLDGGQCDCVYCHLRRRERELERLDFTRERAVFGDHLDHMRRWRFQRGFVVEVECAAGDWLAHADHLTASQPVERVTLTTRPDVRVINRRSYERTDREARRLVLVEEAVVTWGRLKPVSLRCQQSIDLLDLCDTNGPRVTYSHGLLAQDMQRYISSLKYLGGEPGAWWPRIAFAVPAVGQDLDALPEPF